ncbi:MAG: FAD-dependent oxidoreductase [Actinomycetota bacterium]|nr:FAD-dependent oxidoreductase [Actinomycetota bacterium]
MADRSDDPTDRERAEREASIWSEIEIEGPRGGFALSRGDKTRALGRVDRYDKQAQITGYEVLTRTGTIRISFRVLGDDPFRFLPGYFVGIRADVPDQGVRRSPYCIVSPPNDERTFQLLIRLVPEGPLSIYLSSLKVGDRITFRGPSGRSMIPKEEFDELVMLATGVGVGPLLALLEFLDSDELDKPVTLYWGLRLEDDICLIDELEALTKRWPNFRYHITLSQPPPHWDGLRGRITESVPPLLGAVQNKQYHLVGNGAMIAEMAQVLSDLGVDQKLIHEEIYFNVRYRPDPRSLDAIRNRFVDIDPFSPYVHQQGGGLLSLEKPISARRAERAATDDRPPGS